MKPKKFPAKVNGIIFNTEQEYDDRLQTDIDALAKLLYDIYIDKKRKESLADG